MLPQIVGWLRLAILPPLVDRSAAEHYHALVAGHYWKCQAAPATTRIQNGAVRQQWQINGRHSLVIGDADALDSRLNRDERRAILNRKRLHDARQHRPHATLDAILNDTRALLGITESLAQVHQVSVDVVTAVDGSVDTSVAWQ